MSAGPNDPRLLYSIDNVQAFHLQNGEESPLTPSGSQTLSLLMVPTTSSFGEISGIGPPSAVSEEDFYLHLHLPPELDLPLPATTQIYHKPPRSYLIPRWDLGPESGAFTRIEFPRIGTGPNRVSQEDIDTFETILAQCTAFLERAAPPQYDPSKYAAGEGYVGQDLPKNRAGQLVLVDEDDGSVIGELGQGFDVVESENLHPGSKRPVEIRLPQNAEDNKITVQNASEEYLSVARHAAYKDSSLVQNAAVASRLIVAGSTYLSNAFTAGANQFTRKTKANPKPMTFTPTTKARIRKINTLSESAAGLSSRTVAHIGRYAQNLGASLTGRGERKKDTMPNHKPGLLNKSFMAFSTIADGIDQGARNLMASGSTAASTMVGHRYGEDAGKLTHDLTSGVKNVGLVYIDAAGVSRKAIIKSVAKGMIVGRMPNGQAVVVGNGEASK